MRVGFDAKRAGLNFTGLGNYSRSLLRNLGKFYPENQYFLYSPGIKNKKGYPELWINPPFTWILPKTWLGKTLGWLWRSLGVPRLFKKDSIDLFHGLSGELPLGRKVIPYLVTIHDLIFVRYPEFYKPLDRAIYTRKAIRACKKADHILAISEQTKQDIIQFLHIPAGKISVLYQSCGDQFYEILHKEKLLEIKNQYKLPHRYLLCIGTLEPRKRALELVKAYRELPENLRNDVRLVLAGRKTPYFEILTTYIKENRLENQVLFYHSVPNEDLPAFYQMAEIFIYPSTFEGFGIPILEALVSGTPVITSQGSCFSEAGGKSSIYIKPEETLNFAKKIEFVLNNPEIQFTMKKEGLEYSQKFEPGKLSRELMAMYNSIKKI